uniref:TSA: Wollemia nobilis Ref_Wollemi_Transcript_1116_1903 transcribed RNA sequence n=1 Tax=Wollemia nobilis TaxID=56998 RepID=A0A0C9SB20_9CONI
MTMMKVSFFHWKYFYALSCAVLLLFVGLSHISSHFLNLGQSHFMVANYVYNNWELSVSQRAEEESKPEVESKIDRCHGRKIYMYELPQKFNADLLKNCSGGIVPWLDFCRHAQNGGLGRALPNRTGWYESDLYMVELVFHIRMAAYPCRVLSPEEADAFYIPYYIGIDALRFLYGPDQSHAAQHGSELVAWLEENGGDGWRKRGGVDHFMGTGRTAWDLNRPLAAGAGWGTSLLELPALSNVSVLCVERNTWVPREQAVPYLTSFHPVSPSNLAEWRGAVRSARREFLFAFVGAERRHVGLRQAVIQQCRDANNSNTDSTSCAFLDCRQMKCNHNPEPIIQSLLKAEFCLEPPGDSPTRRSTFDALLAGCIPIFFRSDSAYEQYTWHLPPDPDAYSVYIPENTVVNGSLNIADVLRMYSPEARARMRENIIGLIPRLIYTNMGNSGDNAFGEKDAFDLSLDGVLRRARGDSVA